MTSPHSPQDFIAGFDSASTMLDALGHHLAGKSYRGVVPVKYVPDSFLRSLNSLPQDIRSWMYKAAGAQEAVTEETVGRIRSDGIAEWAVGHYPRRRYPAVAIGSANGACIHLCAALGIPWLPQTFLVPVKRSISPDDIEGDIEWGRRVGAALLEANPTLHLHHMHDPIQDRLMVAKMAYFRVKYARLPKAYAQFIRECLEPNGLVLLSNCTYQWPVSVISARHVFQTGGYGTASPTEYLEGSDEITRFLQEQQAGIERWTVRPPDERRPEAEWGYLEEMTGDIDTLVEELAGRILEIAFESPEDLSALVADMHGWWYENRGYAAERLLVDCFAQMDPYTTVSAPAVPYWLPFNTSVSAQRLHQYCKARSFSRAYATLMANGIRGVGAMQPEDWLAILKTSASAAELVGVDEKAYPHDLASFGSFHKALEKALEPFEGPPRPLGVDELVAWAMQPERDYPCRIAWR
ncbi:MAG: hypothetical protein GF331_03865 [Chitinivibrionales bacterium]|nr:hypothetical protein [Chitinivibrionales bacterium]